MARRVTFTKDPLAPVEMVVRTSLFFVTAVLVVFGVLAVVQLAVDGSTDVTVNDVGSGEACGTFDPSGGGTYSSSGDSSGPGGSSAAPTRPPETGIEGFDDDVARYSPDSYRVCLTDATAAQQAVGAATPLAALLGFYAVALAILRAVRSARRDGLFTSATVAGVRRLGWVLVVVAVVPPVVRAVADGVIVAAAVPGRDWYADVDRLGFSWSLLLTAAGVITVARVLEHGVVLQDDVDATI